MSDKEDTPKPVVPYEGKRLSPPRYDYHSYYESGNYFDRKPRYNSDFWRSRYAQTTPILTNDSQKYMLQKCMYDVARIANIYDPNMSLAYKKESCTTNNMRANIIYLDPRIAVDESMDLGRKIDIYAGEILLGTALRNSQSTNPEHHYSSHLNNVVDKSVSPLEAAKSALFLSMEMNEAFHKVREETPGFKEYCYSRVDYLLEKKSDDQLKEAFEQDNIPGQAAIGALIREIDTFNSSPLENYGEFSEVIEEVLDHIEQLETSEERLIFAEELAERYITEQEKREENHIEDNLISAPSMGGKEDDPEKEIEDIAENLLDEEQMEGEKPRNILKHKIFDGAVRNVKTRWVEDIGTVKPSLYEDERKKVLPISESIVDKLQFIDTSKQSWEEHSLKNGELDEGGLEKFAMNSDRVFYKKDIFSLPSIQIGILIDESGSMGRATIVDDRVNYDQTLDEQARLMAIAITNAIKEIKGIDLFVFGHTGYEDCHMFEYITPKTEESNYPALSAIRGRMQNYDGYAIKASGEKMLEESSKEYSRKLLFVISDGEPAGYGYGDEEARKHMKSVCDWLRQDHKLEVYGIGVSNAYNKELGQEMYGSNNSIVLKNFEISEVANIISTFLESIAKSA